MSNVRIVTLDKSNLGKIQMFCGHSPSYRGGYNAKQAWMEKRLQEGMQYKLLQVDGQNAGMIEYLPGDMAWRGVEAKGYLFIHCLWVIGRNRGKGYGRQLLRECMEDASGTNGVAVIASKMHWLPTPKLFLKNGFEVADQAEPSFLLLVNRLSLEAPPPRFKSAVQKPPPGLTLYHSDQCPYTQNIPAIVDRVGESLKIPVNILRLDSAHAAQESPCPYGTLAYFLDDKLLAYQPTGEEKLLTLIRMKKEQSK
jgi:GNAT superfamily N-acetyltransferase